MKKGIIFDMDGTLWDSSQQVAKSWDLALQKCKYEREPITKEDMQGVMGLTMDYIADILFANAKGEQKKEILQACCEVENEYLRQHGGELYPHVRQTMEQLREDGYKLYIVSNCQKGYIEAFLDYYKLWDMIEDRQCYGDNGLPKGENIRILYERNALEQAVYVGDIQGDCDAATHAGIGFIHARYGFGTIDHEVPSIDAFEKLPEVVKRLQKDIS